MYGCRVYSSENQLYTPNNTDFDSPLYHRPQNSYRVYRVYSLGEIGKNLSYILSYVISSIFLYIFFQLSINYTYYTPFIKYIRNIENKGLNPYFYVNERVYSWKKTIHQLYTNYTPKKIKNI